MTCPLRNMRGRAVLMKSDWQLKSRRPPPEYFTRTDELFRSIEKGYSLARLGDGVERVHILQDRNSVGASPDERTTKFNAR